MSDYLVVGGDSPIGTSLVAQLGRMGHMVRWTSRRDADVKALRLDLETLDGLEHLPSVAATILVAAETRFSVCAEDPDRTRRINVDAPAAIAKRMLGCGSRILFFSSASVHDGSVDRPPEDLQPTPASEYGRQKLDAERLLLELGHGVAVLRPSKVVTPDFRLFRDWEAALSGGDTIAPFQDMVLAPIALSFLVQAAIAISSNPEALGIFQLSSSDQVTYAELALWIAAERGFDPRLIAPVSRHAGAASAVPAFARLGCRGLVELLGRPLPASRDALADYFGGRSENQYCPTESRVN